MPAAARRGRAVTPSASRSGTGGFAVGDVVVLGANAKDRLGIVNGTTAVILELDRAGGR